MNKTRFITAALVAVALPLVASSALAQLSDRPGGGGGARAAPAAPAAAAPAAPAVGGGVRGGGMRSDAGAGRGGAAISPQGGRTWAGRPGGGTWAGRPGGWSGGQGWQGHRHGRVFGPSVYFGNTYAGYPYGYDDDTYYDAYPSVTVEPGVSGGDEVAYCQQRYRSYDINSGTFLGYDGQRHPCP